METVRSGDAEIVYEILGQGSPVVLSPPIPCKSRILETRRASADIALSAHHS